MLSSKPSSASSSTAQLQSFFTDPGLGHNPGDLAVAVVAPASCCDWTLDGNFAMSGTFAYGFHVIRTVYAKIGDFS